MTHTLTLNLGVRYDWINNAVSAGGVPLEGITDVLTNTAFVPVSHVLASNPNMMNIDPRIGLAWDPFKDHKTSVRAGFGIFHEPIAARTYAPAYYLAPPTVSYEASTPFPCFPNDPSCSSCDQQSGGLCRTRLQHGPLALCHAVQPDHST